MIKSVIFDLDGTLLNTLGDIHFVLNETLTKFGLPKVTMAQTRQYVGNGAKALVRRALGGNCPERENEIYLYYLEKFSNCDNSRAEFYDGEERALTELKEEGIILSIVTNKPQRATDNVYGKYLSKFGFYRVLGQTEYRPLKPNPTSTLSIIEDLGIKKDECVFVGDGETDLLTAKNAGIKCISVLWGYRERSQLESAGAEILAENFGEIADIICNMK